MRFGQSLYVRYDENQCEIYRDTVQGNEVQVETIDYTLVCLRADE